MWNPLNSLFSRRMNPAEILLDHFDRLAGSEPKFVQVSGEGIKPAIFVAIYRDYPIVNAITGFTVGLSHFHPPGGGHKELLISMLDSDDRWALACGYLAFQLRECCPFACGDTINFGENVTSSTEMSAFLVVQPRHMARSAAGLNLGPRQVELVELVPIYQEERKWILSGGSVESFLKDCPISLSMNPKRKSLVPQ